MELRVLKYFVTVAEELIERLRSGLINLAVITAPYDQTLLNAFKVGHEKMTAFMSRENPLAALPGDTVNLADLKGKPLPMSDEYFIDHVKVHLYFFSLFLKNRPVSILIFSIKHSILLEWIKKYLFNKGR